MESQWRFITRSIGLLILRLGIGGFMATHGWGKLEMVLNNQFDKFADPIGVGNQLSLVLAMFAEFFCALLVLIGLGTRLAAIPIVITMAVAAFVVHQNDPWTQSEAVKLFFAGQTKFPVSKEAALVFLFPFAALIFTGPGAISLDGLICRLWCKRPAA